MTRKIAIVTGTRAEYGILKPLIGKVAGSSRLELQLLVTGLHLLEQYGMTAGEIGEDGFAIADTIPMYEGGNDSVTYHGNSLANGIRGFTSSLASLRPDILVVLGDRLEPLAATLSAATLRIPVAHIHGGDKTDSGHIDESIRHAITRFASIHFTANAEHTNRLARMGEEPWRIHNVGALAIDSIIHRIPLTKAELSAHVGASLEGQYIVCIFHPVHLEKESAGAQAHEIMEALRAREIPAFLIYPNNDAGSEPIIAEIERCRGLPYVRIFKSLPHREYIDLIGYASVLIGNSSSGIVEAPSLKLPVVNIGARNVGREHAANVLFAEPKQDAVQAAIDRALHDESFLRGVRDCKNPYGDGNASEKIMNILENININQQLLRKQITY